MARGEVVMVGGEWWVVSGEGEGEGRLFWIFVAAASRHFVPLPTLLKLEKPLEAEGVEYCTILYILSKYDWYEYKISVHRMLSDASTMRHSSASV